MGRQPGSQHQAQGGPHPHSLAHSPQLQHHPKPANYHEENHGMRGSRMSQNF